MALAGLELQQDIGTLEMGDASHLPPSRQQWQRQVAWRWRRMAKKAGVSSEEGGAGGESSPRLQRFAHAVPVSKVLLVGGATRMPCIGRFLKRLTGLTVRPVVDPEEAVALGAAVSAGILSGAIDQKVSNQPTHYAYLLTS